MLLLLDDDGPPFPRSLFASGEQGIWLDPSDFSTLFQDSAGTTPVTAVGQPVGLALDKRLGLALGSEIITQPVDLTSGWTTVNAATTTVNSFTTPSSGGVQFPFAAAEGEFYECVATIGNDAVVNVFAPANMATIVIGALREVRFFIRIGVGGSSTFYFRNAAAGTTVITNLSIRRIHGNHAYQTTSASRPTLQQDSNGMYYLSFDGTDDGMATPSINFTGTDKMTVWAGVRKLSDALAMICELGSSNAVVSMFSLMRGASGSEQIQSYLRGDSTGVYNSVLSGIYAAPVTLVTATSFDISGATKQSLRLNGTVAATSTTSVGAGNFGNYPLYIGRRGGTTLPFNGRIYQLIIRGAASNAGQIAAGEAWMNGKTRAY